MVNRFICLVLLSLLSLPAQSAMVYMDRLPFEATLGSSITDGYDKGIYPSFFYNNADMSAVLGETAYTSTTLTSTNYVPVRASDGESYYCSGCDGSFLLDFTSTSVGTAAGVYGVGFDVFYSGAPIIGVTAFVTFGDNSTMDFTLPDVIQDPSSNADPTKFWGITDSLLIASIHFGLPGGIPFDPMASVRPTMALDNLTIGSMGDMSAVPVPAAIWLFGSAILGLAGFRRHAASRRA